MNNSVVEFGGIGVSSAQAGKWLREVNRLEKRLGRAPTDSELLDAARDPDSSLHAFVFNVGQEKAAHAYYISRVQLIMRNLAAITTTVSGEKAKFRLFVRTDDGYERTTEIEPGSATAESISRKLALEIAAVQRRAEAWKVLIGSPELRKRASAVIKHLDAAATIANATTSNRKGNAA